ncbi:DUF1624 domain-containing protein [Propioniciclava coleopterorum]|uniref:DUF1624 domain-containing protein n=1 Tax=Propioniciclava coleopterorum TaxID=2714937 RepID=A0A6G7Y6V2_9ACTN|nr:heparan-alpha-glucosaminide N-acetyltransferase domain-containing protein [Propioniciclava coleopterorum]QIK72513.1 DUF1624 domain-containing protein [Propioniciclava coleopterorum]
MAAVAGVPQAGGSRSEDLPPPPGPAQPATGTLPHACEEPSHPRRSGLGLPIVRQPRLFGLDMARGLAIVGMMIVHVTPMVTSAGTKPAAWLLSSGNAAALFAVLAGVGVGLTTGRSTPPRGRRWVAACLNLLVRMVFIGTIGLLLGFFIPAEHAEIILPTYAVLFVMLIPFLRASPLFNLSIGVILALLAPVASHMIRNTWALPGWDALQGVVENRTLLDPIIDPVGTLQFVVLTGAFPALTWFAYSLVGLGTGRARMANRIVAVRLLLGGFVVACTALIAEWILMDVVGGRNALGAVAARTMSLENFTDILVWGATGTVPTTDWWWNAVLAPHTGTSLDLLFTLGVATSVLGACLVIGRVAAAPFRPLAALGSMPLTAYVGHLIMLEVPALGHDSWPTLLIQLGILVAFALVWRTWFARGPLEAALALLTDAIKRAFSGPYRPARSR